MNFDEIENRVNELLTALERIAAALEIIARELEHTDLRAEPARPTSHPSGERGV